MAVGIIIIGDEILSGRRQDKHLPKIIELLAERGMQLDWAEYVGDDPARITATLRRSFASDDIVFVTGGIGATPDDHTRQCAAAALGVPLVLTPEAEALIMERIADTSPDGRADMSQPDNRHRLKMGEFPVGARVLPNPYNKIPGFSVAQHHFMPGFPVMAWPMMAWVLDRDYAALHHLTKHAERSVLVFGLAESTLTPLMEAIEAEYHGVKVFSLPSVGDPQRGEIYARRHIDLGVKGDPSLVGAAFERLIAGVDALGGEIIDPAEAVVPPEGAAPSAT
ncbi:competence/damage-inducible protein A [Pandoraea communis]|uniref:Competence/damage-inducible protein A n=1 Tax=Pandoraea communis TaxID=2508297 RepID=A0A5E4YCC4_9BURK|nr:molybdopterin-binding protein [Pandoraea communis]MDM8357719.1 molybdopterin-binding protein [Pandoraea communis]VVE46344.1 competence/damage-inducible protein A [Pandoraea communis]